MLGILLSGCIFGLTVTSVVKPFARRSVRIPLSHFLVITAWCCSKTSDTMSMHALFDPGFDGSSTRKILVSAMSISVRFSTPLNLKMLGRLWTDGVGSGVADEKVEV